MVKSDLQASSFPCAVMMENFLGDFNISTVIRNANAFNVREVYYLGMKHYDRRGTVGTHHYIDVNHLKERKHLEQLKEKYVLVGLENSVPSCVPMADFEWPDNALIVIGEEGVGITPETIELCDQFVYIPQYGSVRSLNAGVASGIALNDYVVKRMAKISKNNLHL
jgi:tRNA G18 (ribose-2'-O)-methylase SpoU